MLFYVLQPGGTASWTNVKSGERPPSPTNTPFWLEPKAMVIAAIVLFALLTAWLAAFNTQAGTVDIVLRWGAPIRVTEPGLNFKLPYVETPPHRRAARAGLTAKPTSWPRAIPWN